MVCWERLNAGREGDDRMRWLDGTTGHEFEPALGLDDGQGILSCCSPWGCNESDIPDQVN